MDTSTHDYNDHKNAIKTLEILWKKTKGVELKDVTVELWLEIKQMIHSVYLKI